MSKDKGGGLKNLFKRYSKQPDPGTFGRSHVQENIKGGTSKPPAPKKGKGKESQINAVVQSEINLIQETLRRCGWAAWDRGTDENWVEWVDVR